jgi:hypothetical protein
MTREPDFLTVEVLREHLKNYGPRAGVIAQQGNIVFFDTEEGGAELGSIQTPGARE